MPIILGPDPDAVDITPLSPDGITNGDIPHLQFPLQVAGGNLAVVGQDTTEDIAQCVEAILRTPVGLSDSIPELGLTYQPFYEGGADVHEIQQQLSQHEPRTDVLVTDDPSRLNEALSLVKVQLST